MTCFCGPTEGDENGATRGERGAVLRRALRLGAPRLWGGVAFPPKTCPPSWTEKTLITAAAPPGGATLGDNKWASAKSDLTLAHGVSDGGGDDCCS